MTQTFRRSRHPLNANNYWWHRLRMSTQKFALTLTVLAVSLGFSYVWLTNQTAAQGFAIDELQQRIAELQTGNEKLELQAADLRALSAVKSAAENLALEPTDEFDVLTTVTGAVAVQP